MSTVQKVIILNKPFKLFGFTIPQGLLVVASGLLGLLVGSNLPSFKIAGAPLLFWITFLSICSALIFVSASQMKPWIWWRNRILSVAGLTSKEILPKFQPAKVYLTGDNIDESSLLDKGKPIKPRLSKRFTGTRKQL